MLLRMVLYLNVDSYSIFTKQNEIEREEEGEENHV